MREVVLATEQEFSKGEDVFRSASHGDVRPAPAEEYLLSVAVITQNSRAVIVGAAPYRGPLYEALGKTGRPSGAIIARFGVGHDGINKPLARQNNIMVTNTPGVLDQSVAEHTIWLMGNLARQLSSSEGRLRSGQFTGQTGIEVCGKTLGLIGFGAIARRVAAIAHFGLGMRVLAAGRRSLSEMEEQEGLSLAQIQARFGVDHYTHEAESVLRQADIVSLHLPANDQTRHFINAQRLALMRPGSILINTARGSLLDESALHDALVAGRLAGAALDVFENEPYAPVSPEKDLRTLQNVVLTPHVGSNTRESNWRMAHACLENISKFFEGRFAELSRVDDGT